MVGEKTGNPFSTKENAIPYNPVVFASFGTNLYYPLLAKESILMLDDSTDQKYDLYDVMFGFGGSLSDKTATYPTDPHWEDPNIYESDPLKEVQRLKKLYAAGRLERLENDDCLKANDGTPCQKNSKECGASDSVRQAELDGRLAVYCEKFPANMFHVLLLISVLRYVTVLVFIAWLLKNGTRTATARDGVTGSALITSLGFGKANSRTTLHIGLKDLLTNAVIVSIPQVILSWIYFSYNGLLTLMSLAREWETYVLSRKGLRISGIPEGEQRSTYFLQLPYRIAVPFTILSAFLHWLVSQSFFLVSVQLYAYSAADGWHELRGSPVGEISCGYSLLPLVALLVTGGALLVAIFVMGFVPLRSTTPIVGSCSAAIAAACQPLGEDDSEAAVMKVQWGVMGCFEDGYEHCGMSRRPVRELVKQETYR
ncbi:hypothetical protein N0V90_010177 [Kalmusia sp. IMI 367209]|nr:hypothetical protein N0V90_010177 [Kalmusia sp. IMI 367209]